MLWTPQFTCWDSCHLSQEKGSFVWSCSETISLKVAIPFEIRRTNNGSPYSEWHLDNHILRRHHICITLFLTASNFHSHQAAPFPFQLDLWIFFRGLTPSPITCAQYTHIFSNHLQLNFNPELPRHIIHHIINRHPGAVEQVFLIQYTLTTRQTLTKYICVGIIYSWNEILLPN